MNPNVRKSRYPKPIEKQQIQLIRVTSLKTFWSVVCALSNPMKT